MRVEWHLAGPAAARPPLVIHSSSLPIGQVGQAGSQWEGRRGGSLGQSGAGSEGEKEEMKEAEHPNISISPPTFFKPHPHQASTTQPSYHSPGQVTLVTRLCQVCQERALASQVAMPTCQVFGRQAGCSRQVAGRCLLAELQPIVHNHPLLTLHLYLPACLPSWTHGLHQNTVCKVEHESLRLKMHNACNAIQTA